MKFNAKMSPRKKTTQAMLLWISIKLNTYSIHLTSSGVVGGTLPKSASQHEQAITSYAVNTLILQT